MNHFLLAESFFRQVGHSPLLLGCLAVAVFLAVALVRAVSRRRHRPHRRPHSHRWQMKDESNPAAKAAPQGERETRPRRRRRRRAALNPTLAETRGLPPVRNESSSPPPY